MTVVAELTDVEREILRVGCAVYDEDGAMLNAIHDLGMGQAQFFHGLNALLETERALAYDAVNVYRLRRLRDARIGRRGGRS